MNDLCGKSPNPVENHPNTSFYPKKYIQRRTGYRRALFLPHLLLNHRVYFKLSLWYRGCVKSQMFEILAKGYQIKFWPGAKFDNFLKVVKFSHCL